MTPRQLHSYMWLRQWRREEELAAFSTAVRYAQNASKEDFQRFLDSLTK